MPAETGGLARSGMEAAAAESVRFRPLPRRAGYRPDIGYPAIANPKEFGDFSGIPYRIRTGVAAVKGG